MSRESKPKIEDFPQWCRDTLRFDPTEERYRTNYDANANNARLGIVQHQFATEADTVIAGLSQQSISPLPVLMSTQLNFLTKSYSSLLNKLYRANILYNRNFPDEPNDGWITPSNCYSKVNDIVRSMLVCKYLDGPERVANELTSVAARLGLQSYFDSRANDSGYYAYHFYVKIPVNLLDLEWRSISEIVTVEIQITTQLQEVLKELTHIFYEDIRLQAFPDKQHWKWQFKSPRFMASYLGHTLHLLEGIIVQLKDQVAEPETDKSPRTTASSTSAIAADPPNTLAEDV